MAKAPIYKRSAQYQNLRDKLDEAGCTVQGNVTTYFEQGAMHKLLIFRDHKPPLSAVVVDWPEDGYALYLAVPTIRIEDDLAALLAAA